MPIKIPETLPAFDVLRHEGVMVMSEETARYLGGDPVIVKAGRYRLEYHAKQNTKSVVFE